MGPINAGIELVDNKQEKILLMDAYQKYVREYCSRGLGGNADFVKPSKVLASIETLYNFEITSDDKKDYAEQKLKLKHVRSKFDMEDKNVKFRFTDEDIKRSSEMAAQRPPQTYTPPQREAARQMPPPRPAQTYAPQQRPPMNNYQYNYGQPRPQQRGMGGQPLIHRGGRTHFQEGPYRQPNVPPQHKEHEDGISL